MFTAKVYKVMVGSLSGAMEEYRIALDAITQWNTLCGEKKGIIYLPVNEAVADVYLFIIDNYIDKGFINSVIATGAKVNLFFRGCHDPLNTIPGELEQVRIIRERIQHECTCFDYRDNDEFVRFLLISLES